MLDVAASPPSVPIWKQPRPVDWQAYTCSMNSEENPHVGHPYAPLEKIPGAWKASQYRPLTVFSIVYRTWSSIRSKEALAYLSQFVSDHVTGNIPGKSCTDLWLNIQLHLEECEVDDAPTAGVVADLVKAFNLLPRIPLLAIGLHLGVAQSSKPGQPPLSKWHGPSASGAQRTAADHIHRVCGRLWTQLCSNAPVQHRLV